MSKFYKKTNYLLTKDPIIFFQLTRGEEPPVQHMRNNIYQMKRHYKSHPLGFKVPFLAKVRAIQYADSTVLKATSFQIEDDDKFEAFLDAEGKKRTVKMS
jgi:hypothetical protein